MKRRIFAVFLFLLLAGCGARNEALQLPENVAGWRLSTAKNAGETWTATYDGEPRIALRLTRMSSGAVAFSAVQSWRGEAGKLAFFHGRYFGIAEAAGADHRTLNRFVSAMEKTLPE